MPPEPNEQPRCSLDDVEPSLRRSIVVASGAVSGTEAGEIVRAVTCDDLQRIERLELTEVKTLRGLERLPSLRELRVGEIADGDLAPLARSPLRKLAISPFPEHTAHAPPAIRDLSPLAQITTLEELRIDTSAVTDLSALGSLIHLRALTIARGKVVDIAPLARLVSLRELHLDSNPIADLAPLSSLVQLEWLTLLETAVTDASPLEAMTGLRSVVLCRTPVIEDPDTAKVNSVRLERLRKRGVHVPTSHACHCC